MNRKKRKRPAPRSDYFIFNTRAVQQTILEAKHQDLKAAHVPLADDVAKEALEEAMRHAVSAFLREEQPVPRWGETVLLLVLSRKMHKTVPGDLEEDFRADVVKWGLRRARCLYWREVARYVGRLVLSLARYGAVAWIMQKIGR
jgi:hypothetical protein